jgi:hypothetical protein
MERQCVCCKDSFRPDRYHPGQKFCCKALCQRYRRSAWQRDKLKADPDYRTNQADSQARWKASHPDYWKGYRAAHPAYVERNRAMLRDRRNRLAKPIEQSPPVAKMDVAALQPPVISGRYRLEPLEQGNAAKMDFVIVQLLVLPALAESL